MASKKYTRDVGPSVMYAENKTCKFFTIDLYSLELNEIIRSTERGIVYEGKEPRWEQLLEMTGEFLSGDDIEYYTAVDEEDIGLVCTKKHWITAQGVNGEAVIVRIGRPPAPPPTP